MDDEIVRLPTDVSVEGQEMFNASFSIAENLHYLLRPFEYYIEPPEDPLTLLPGCTNVEISQEDRKVLLSYHVIKDSVCQKTNLRRSGKISLEYTNSFINNEEIILVNYQDYSVNNVRLNGIRYLTKKSDSTFKDNMVRMMIYDEHGSSTRMTAEYDHYLQVTSDSTLMINTTGAGGGRNMAGRTFNFTLNTPRVQSIDCIEQGIFVPTSGEETWTFERTVSSAVTHRLNFGDASSGCDRNVSISLSNGETLLLRP
ncbi:hypothetical protein [Anditalea andensis]|uniref:Uncharacterized protein n=1 Tax=Anditalea andensis TaxID=1048983 RepID=A0A074KW20_9BACT|nr:hypothetical protein [Anditalea andensis]KEO72455.1 hypothetical protein EL17_17090 [Anditalea andensis]